MARTSVLLCSDQAAMADAVARAVAAAGLVPVVLDPIVVGQAPPAVPAGDAQVGLLLCPLTPESCLETATALVDATEVPWVIVASTPQDPAWEAVLTAGAVRVLDAQTTVADIVEVLSTVARG